MSLLTQVHLACRSMFFAEDLTWNVRDTHMTDTATHLNEYLSTQRKIQRPKIAICASLGLHWSSF